jgi:hypothetical protein
VIFSLDNTGGLSLPAYLLVQSSHLGGDIRTASNTLGYWRLLPLQINNQSPVYQFANSRVDGYFEYPRTIQDIDITLVQPDGTVLPPPTSFTVLIEIEYVQD